MKFYRQITSNWDENQVKILRQYNIDVDKGINRINIYDLDLYKQLIPLFEMWDVGLDFLGEDFTKREIVSAEYCIIKSWNSCGYPMPDYNMGYLYNTYEKKYMCSVCGIDMVQKDDFRVRKVPKYPIWGLGWIFDEFFVRTDLYKNVFKPLGIGCRPLRKYKDDSIVDTYVQLVIPVIDEPLDLSFYDPQTCPKCGVTKYDPKVRGFSPLQDHPLPYIYKSKEFFGDGFSANRKIFVSAFVRDMMIENGLFKLRSFSPCAKAEELSVKNQNMPEWLYARRNKKHISKMIVAIPD